MIIVMKRGASDRDLEHVVTLIREMGLSEHVSVGTDRTIDLPPTSWPAGR